MNYSEIGQDNLLRFATRFPLNKARDIDGFYYGNIQWVVEILYAMQITWIISKVNEQTKTLGIYTGLRIYGASHT